MLTDDQLAGTIGARLRAEVADIDPPPDLMTTLRRRQARRSLAIGGGIATSLAAAVGVVALVAAGAGPPPTQTTPGGTSTARLDTVAFVAQQADAALAKADQFVIGTQTAGNSGDGIRNDAWQDTATGRYRTTTSTTGGRPIGDVQITVGDPGHGGTVLVVDHTSRSWWTYPLAAGRADLPNDKILPETSADPASIRAAIAAGKLEVRGHDRTDGRDTLHLHLTGLPQKASSATMQEDLWVDATSYLPVRLTVQAGSKSLSTTFTWLPRSPENLAKLDLVPPPGYVHRAATPGTKPGTSADNAKPGSDKPSGVG